MKRQILALLLAMAGLISVAKNNIYYGKLLRDGVRYTGRVLVNDDRSVSYNWSGVYLQTAFTGGSIAVEATESGQSYHNVFIDGRFVKRVKFTGKAPFKVTLAEHLGKGSHVLRLQKATEGSFGTTTIRGFYLEKGGKLSPIAPKKRFIEVFGDSYTCGYGALASSPKERFSLETEDVNKSYACVIARYFDADYAIEAHSGFGVVRNYNDKKQASENTMLHRMGLVFDVADTIAYDYQAYKPDIVLIQLGTNDFSTSVCPTPAQYVNGYKKMISKLRKAYGNVPILCCLPFSATLYLQAAFAELAHAVAADKQVYIGESMLKVMNADTDMGADWHPNVAGHRKISMKLIPQIANIMGWEMPQTVVK